MKKMNTDSNPFAEGPECDFCNIALDSDEGPLQPIYVGEQPTPKPHHLREVQKKSRRIGDGYQVLGVEAEAFIALYKALENCPDVDLNFAPVVDDVRSVSGESRFVTDAEQAHLNQGVRGDVSLDTYRNEDLVGVSLKIRPKAVEDDPDAMVCEDCAEMFRNI